MVFYIKILCDYDLVLNICCSNYNLIFFVKIYKRNKVVCDCDLAVKICFLNYKQKNSKLETCFRVRVDSC